MAPPKPSPQRTHDPDVVVDIRWRDAVFYLVLHNIAPHCVHDVRVAFRPKIMGMGGRVDISGLPIWDDLAILPPGREIEVAVDRDGTFFLHNPEGPVGVSVRYALGDGTALRGFQTINFGAYREFPDLRIT
ncbi:hypothetical protein [Jannaschia sp. CCS1]|uniref:hypothetical protein n=1 Tax=Jannaschia sp. (strain CCS1) TaxID=290400 RepID=UPI000053C968|nr:hypothetical protein [Jannaschia sp. CCS1]ABD55108.1 hypothetical protein Jann_2191 [Jannaschia sp. CCS1]